MNVRSQMTAAVVTISPDATVDEARRCLTTTGLRCVPVTQAGRLVGLVLDTDPVFVQALDGASVTSVMRSCTARIQPGASIERAARLMLEHGVQGLPVVTGDDTLVGVLTVSDLLRSIVRSPPIVLW